MPGSAAPPLAFLPGRLAICRLTPDALIPIWALEPQPFITISRTPDELSIACEEHRVPDDVRAERGFRALKVQGALPLDAVGVIAGLTAPLASAAIPVFALSTYDTDYLLVREERLHAAVETLRAAGYDVEVGAWAVRNGR
jgi:uncharacterized protein